MRVWRLCRERHAGGAFSGEGARLAGGRWNHPGVAVVYCSATLSLAVLESLVHFEARHVPDDYVAIAADIPDEIPVRRVEVAELPTNWRAVPAPEALQDLGDAWIGQGDSLVLAVPSVVVPAECNYLVNPVHEEFRRIVVHPPTPFAFDPRLWA